MAGLVTERPEELDSFQLILYSHLCKHVDVFLNVSAVPTSTSPNSKWLQPGTPEPHALQEPKGMYQNSDGPDRNYQHYVIVAPL